MNDTFPPLALDAPVAAPSRSSLWIALGVLVVMLTTGLLAWLGIAQYNALLTNEARVGFAWNQVISQYTRRADLVPGLVQVVRAYTQHEEDLFAEISAGRARLGGLAEGARAGNDAQKLAQFQAAQSQLSVQLGRLLAVADRSPALTAGPLYQDLMVQLEGTENRLAYARQQYFESLADYNLGLRHFPGSLIAQRAGLQPKQPVALVDDRVVRPAAQLELK